MEKWLSLLKKYTPRKCVHHYHHSNGRIDQSEKLQLTNRKILLDKYYGINISAYVKADFSLCFFLIFTLCMFKLNSYLGKASSTRLYLNWFKCHCNFNKKSLKKKTLNN